MQEHANTCGGHYTCSVLMFSTLLQCRQRCFRPIRCADSNFISGAVACAMTRCRFGLVDVGRPWRGEQGVSSAAACVLAAWWFAAFAVLVTRLVGRCWHSFGLACHLLPSFYNPPWVVLCRDLLFRNSSKNTFLPQRTLDWHDAHATPWHGLVVTTHGRACVRTPSRRPWVPPKRPHFVCQHVRVIHPDGAPAPIHLHHRWPRKCQKHARNYAHRKNERDPSRGYVLTMACTPAIGGWQRNM